MSMIQSELKYTKSHEWVRNEGDGILTIGISDHAQALLGDLVFVELAEVEANVNAGDDVTVVESVKAASDVYSPVAGEITEVNEALSDTPELVNSDPFGEGWLFKIRYEDESEMDDLLDADAYKEYVESEEH